jgi:hypothetical protein
MILPRAIEKALSEQQCSFWEQQQKNKESFHFLCLFEGLTTHNSGPFPS